MSRIFFSESDFFSKSIIPGHPLHPIKSAEAGVFLGEADTEELAAGAHKFLAPALGPKPVRHCAPTMQATVELVYRYKFSLWRTTGPSTVMRISSSSGRTTCTYVRAERRVKWPPKSEQGVSRTVARCDSDQE